MSRVSVDAPREHAISASAVGPPAIAPTISVIVPTYNDRDTIQRCIESLLQQSHPAFEIIVVDDGSTDGTAEVLQDLPLTLVRREQNDGAAVARATGAARAKGEVLAFLDADCVAPGNWLRRIAQEFASDASLLGFGGAYTHRAPRSLVGRAIVLEEEYVRHVYRQHPDRALPPGGNCAYRRAAWERARTTRELYYFGHMASGEDSVVGDDIRRSGKVVFDADFVVEHVQQSENGYLRKHFRRGLSRSTIINRGLTSADETQLVFAAFGGWPLFLGSLCLGLSLLALGALPFAPLIAGTATLLFALLHAALTAPFFAVAIAHDAMRQDELALSVHRQLVLRFLLFARTLCWIAGATVGASRYIAYRVGVLSNIVLSIAHFWRPGRISKLFFFVTSRCNARCSFCFNLENVVNWKSRQPLELSVQEIERIAKRFGRLPYLTLSGGEPFVRADLADVVHAFYKHAKTQWLTIPTNAALVRNTVAGTVEILNRCPGMFLTIQVSIDSLYEDHDTSRVIRGGFAKMTETLKQLGRIRQRYGNLRIQLATCYDDFNRHRINEIVEFCRANFEFDQHMFYLIRDSHTRITQRNNHLVAPFTALVTETEAWEWRNQRRSLWSIAVRALHGLTYRDLARIKLTDEYIRPCAATQKFATLWDNGEVSPCEVLEFTRLGNIRDYDYDYYQLKSARQINELHRDKIVDAKCNCDWACAPPINMLYDVNTYASIARAMLHPGEVLRRVRPLADPRG